MSFTYETGTSRGQLRLHIGDTHADTAVFTDAEIDGFLARGGGLEGGKIEALRAMMSIAALRGESERVSAIQAALEAIGGNVQAVSIVWGGAIESDDAWEDPT